MGKKEKQKIAALEAENAHLKELADRSAKAQAALQAKHAELTAEAGDVRAQLKSAQESLTARKRELAERENTIAGLEAAAIKARDDAADLKMQLEQAKEAARESAEAAEAAAATATAAAAAAAAMAMDDDEDEAEDGGGDGSGSSSAESRMADRMADAEAKRETQQAEVDAIKAVVRELRTSLAEEQKQRQNAEKRCSELEDQQGLKLVSKKLRESEAATHKAGTELVAQAEKNLKLHDKLATARDRLAQAEEDVATVRHALICEIAGPDAEYDLYGHIAFGDLVRLALQGKQNGVNGGKSSVLDDGASTASAASGTRSMVLGGDNTKLDGIRKAEAEIKGLRTALRNSQLELERQRGVTAKVRATADKVTQLKDKNMELANRVAREKDRFMSQKEEVRRRDERIQALSDHIEKLMVHLKHEAAAKAKAADGQRRAGREVSVCFAAAACCFSGLGSPFLPSLVNIHSRTQTQLRQHALLFDRTIFSSSETRLWGKRIRPGKRSFGSSRRGATSWRTSCGSWTRNTLSYATSSIGRGRSRRRKSSGSSPRQTSCASSG